MDRIRKLAIKTNNKKRYYRHIEYPEIPLSVGDVYVITSFGDRLDNLANEYYKNSELWWIISCANPGVVRRDSFFIKTGLQIRIPTGIENIKRKFEELNF
jgi:hypothetical protein